MPLNVIPAGAARRARIYRVHPSRCRTGYTPDNRYAVSEVTNFWREVAVPSPQIVPPAHYNSSP